MKIAEATTIQQQDHRKHIIVKEHPSNPCARYYEDIFGTIIVECRHPEHDQLLLNEKGEGNQPSPRETEPRTNNHTTPTTTTHTQQSIANQALDQEVRLVVV